MTVKLEKGDAAQYFSSLPEHKERVGAGNHRPDLIDIDPERRGYSKL